MSSRIAVLCATRRGYLFLKTLIGLLPEAELVVFSFECYIEIPTPDIGYTFRRPVTHTMNMLSGFGVRPLQAHFRSIERPPFAIQEQAGCEAEEGP
jgi:hypothetical protein